MKSFRRKRYGRSRFRRRTFRKSYPRKSFKKRVMSAVYKYAELKQISGNFNSNITTSTTLVKFINNNIPQGPGDNQRIGNTIMSRNWQFKFVMQIADLQNPVGDVNVIKWFRVRIVWPKKMDYASASAYINSTTFPIYGMTDPDNFIIWYDKTFALTSHPELSPQASNILNFRFNKRFTAKLEFKQGTDSEPVKQPIIVFSGFPDVATWQWSWNGYAKLSYKDI